MRTLIKLVVVAFVVVPLALPGLVFMIARRW